MESPRCAARCAVDAIGKRPARSSARAGYGRPGHTSSVARVPCCWLRPPLTDSRTWRLFIVEARCLGRGHSDVKKVEQTYKFPNHAHLHFPIRLKPLRSLYRRIVVRTYRSVRSECAVACAMTSALEGAADQLAAQSCSDADDVIVPEFHGRWVSERLKSIYFNPKVAIAKS